MGSMGMQHASNTVAETKALILGMQTCIDKRHLNVDIKVDSLILPNIVQLKIPVGAFRMI